jgi:hypothetical protein
MDGYSGQAYMLKDARQSALEEIARKMGLENFTTEDDKQKIKNLSATYQQESRKIDKSLSSSTLFPVHFTFDSCETTLTTLHLKLNL